VAMDSRWSSRPARGSLGRGLNLEEMRVVLQNDCCSADLNRLRADRTSGNGLRPGQLLLSRYLPGFVCKRLGSTKHNAIPSDLKTFT
jgi:hypothetical protein